MPGLDPAIHAAFPRAGAAAWMPGSSPGMTTNGWENNVSIGHLSLSKVALSVVMLAAAYTPSFAQEMNAALKELAAAANKDGTLTLSWSGSTLAGVQGAAR